MHFLYGQRPKITIDNAANILEMAEFLIICELKAWVISELRSIGVTTENCMPLLAIATRFDFEFESVINFSLAHLPELLLKEETLYIDKESVFLIFTDRTLSYVSRDDCFTFLLKWTKLSPRRNTEFSELLSCLHIAYVRPEVLNDMDLSFLTTENKLLCNTLTNNKCVLDNIFIIYPATRNYSKNKYSFNAFNLDRNSWFHISIPQHAYWIERNSVGLKHRDTIVATKGNNTLWCFNLTTNKETEKDIQWLDEAVTQEPTADLPVHHTTRNAQSTALVNMGQYSNILSVSKEKLYVVRRSLYEEFDVNSSCRLRSVVDISTFYFEDRENDISICMKPLFSVKGRAASACVTGQFVCLLLKESRKLFIYAMVLFSAATVDLSNYTIDYRSTITAAAPDGRAYIATYKHLIQIDLHWKDSKIMSRVCDKSVETESIVPIYQQWRQSFQRFEFAQDKVVTIARKQDHFKSTLSYTCQSLPENINCLHQEETFVIDMPDQLKNHDDIHFLQTQLPQNMARCDIDCPHCRYTVKDETKHFSINSFFTAIKPEYVDYDDCRDDYSDIYDEDDYNNYSDGGGYGSDVYWDASADEFVPLYM